MTLYAPHSQQKMDGQRLCPSSHALHEVGPVVPNVADIGQHRHTSTAPVALCLRRVSADLHPASVAAMPPAREGERALGYRPGSDDISKASQPPVCSTHCAITYEMSLR